ncbi:MAG TPA: hypothetical protein VJ598_10875, partial [Albitalea sp.]|nr:hypothetical protein [Albitalea sp.]
LHTDWMGLPSTDVKDEVKLDVSEQMTPQELAAQLQAVQAGHLSAESFIENLFAAGIAREPDLEQERLASQAPADQPQPAEQVLGMPSLADGAVAA